MEILEKVAYMKGLAEGLGLDGQTKEGKLLTVMMDILDDMALELQDMREGQIDLEEALDAVSDDLSDVESRVYQTTCPSCGEEIFFDETILEDGGVRCPDCGEKLEFDLDESEGCPNCCGACGSAGEDEDDDEE